MAFPAALKSLHTELIGARREYEDAIKDSPAGGRGDFVRRLLDMRTKAIGEIRDALAAAGEADPKGGLVMSLVHRAVVGLRAMVPELSADSLPFVKGEARILLAYNNAIEECRGYPRIASVIETQRAEVAGIVAKMIHAAAEDRPNPPHPPSLRNGFP
jgi:hypothetical protein